MKKKKKRLKCKYVDTSGITARKSCLADKITKKKDLINNWKYKREFDFSNLHRGELLLNNSVVTANEILLQEKNQMA